MYTQSLNFLTSHASQVVIKAPLKCVGTIGEIHGQMYVCQKSVFCQNGETDLSLARRLLCNAVKTNLCELLSFLYIFTTELPALTISEL